MFKFIKKLFKKKSKQEIVDENPNDEIFVESMVRDGYKFERGMKVICKSNEPDDFMIGKVKDFKHLRKWGDIKHSMPLVEEDGTGKVWYVMGILRPYTHELASALSTLKPIEQWNYLAKPHAQIEEKYGITYKTFNQNL